MPAHGKMNRACGTHLSSFAFPRFSLLLPRPAQSWQSIASGRSISSQSPQRAAWPAAAPEASRPTHAAWHSASTSGNVDMPSSTPASPRRPPRRCSRTRPPQHRGCCGQLPTIGVAP
eukprot:scaffold1352_cov261-Pinguiococcus_pyrenoidosus.AAC.13